MKNTTWIAAATVVAAFTFLPVHSQALEVPMSGTLNVTVLDENGALVQNAPVFIYGDRKNKLVAGKEIPGTATLNMAAGTYRISSAVVRTVGNYLDRFVSNEATVNVVAGDNAVVVLHLKALQSPIESLGMGSLDASENSGQFAQRF